jgi:tetratricopeptide (TPR) repeat protein
MNQTRGTAQLTTHQRRDALIAAIKAKYEAAACTRRGICLLNAGDFDEAAAAFTRAMELGDTSMSLAACLAACYRALGEPGRSTAALSRAVHGEPDHAAGRIRQALAQWEAGRRDDAILTLREGLRIDPECAEYHFQLGTLLTCLEYYEEAELRFVQALNIDRDHVEALLSLAMCCGLRGAPAESVVHLQRAQARRPHDPRIGLFLSQAVKAVQQQGRTMRVQARMFDDAAEDLDAEGLEELSRIIEQDPDFVDAFLSIPFADVDEKVFGILLRTIQAALERQPEHAELHFHCGRVLERLGDRKAAIYANERAVTLDPSFTRALIELARLYQQTDRQVDAVTRLEQAIAAGAEYADVYFMLGNLYRDAGRPVHARLAYRRALNINDRYEAARKALSSLESIGQDGAFSWSA